MHSSPLDIGLTATVPPHAAPASLSLAIQAPSATQGTEIDLTQQPARVRTTRRATSQDLRGLVQLFHGAEANHSYAEIAQLTAHFTDGAHRIFVAAVGDKLVGAISAGQYGVRAVIYPPITLRGYEEMAAQLVGCAAEGLKSAGVQRAHLLTEHASPCACELFESIGFSHPAGEKLMERHISAAEARTSSPRPIQGLEANVRRGTISDIEPLLKAISSVQEIAFQPWEREILRRWAATQDEGLFLVATDPQGRYLGVVIGGVCGGRGTVNHIWVAEEARKNRLGQHLADHAMNYFVGAQAREVHVMVTEGNAVAERFWSSRQFQVAQGYGFLEKDL